MTPAALPSPAEQAVIDRFGIFEPEEKAAEPTGELLHAAREWIWRHSSQPDGDRWRDNPDHLDWAAQNLLIDLRPWLSAPPTHGHPPDTRNATRID